MAGSDRLAEARRDPKQPPPERRPNGLPAGLLLRQVPASDRGLVLYRIGIRRECSRDCRDTPDRKDLLWQ